MGELGWMFQDREADGNGQIQVEKCSKICVWDINEIAEQSLFR